MAFEVNPKSWPSSWTKPADVSPVRACQGCRNAANGPQRQRRGQRGRDDPRQGQYQGL